jgi:hypothetical protein
MILKISKKLKENNIYHKVEGNLIKTRRSNTKIPSINKDIIYLIGVIAGDGCLTRSKRKRGGHHHKVRITSNSDIFLDYLNNIFKENFSVEGHISKDKRKRSTYNLAVSNASIFWYFEILESKYNKTNKLPKICKNEKFFENYLAGLIDTDGSIGKSKKRVQLKLKNQKIINEIYSRINQANPNPPKINYTNNIPFYYIRFDNIFPLRWKTATLLNQEN